MTLDEQTITRYTLTCDECKTSVTFDGWDNKPPGWRSAAHPTNWDLNNVHFCSKTCQKDYTLRAIDAAD